MLILTEAVAIEIVHHQHHRYCSEDVVEGRFGVVVAGGSVVAD